MIYRSTNVDGKYVHFGGDLIAGVDSSNGVHLYGSSTGGKITACSDDANTSLKIEGKGTGGVIIGNSSQAVTLADSTAAFKGFHFKTSTWSNAAISSGAVVELTFASTTFDVSYGDLVSVSFQDLIAPVVMGGFRLSTVATSVLTVQLAVPGSTASSTLSGSMQVAWADLT
jgi:hypothetical protein